ncbi:MAG: helix-turn-helix transcriptional regulator [Planctomycetota bacterium]
MLGKTLQRVIDQKLTSAKELGELAGVSTSTVYRWIAGQSQPDFDSIRLLVRHLPDNRAQEEILQAFTSGTDWLCTRMDLELDVNDDGQIDADDALDATIECVKGASESLAAIRARMHEPMTADETLQTVALLNHVMKHCAITQRVLVDMNEQRQKRKLKLAK